MNLSQSRYPQYWQFFWPLALNGMVILLGQQTFNGVLARHADPERELAVYACAIGIFYFFDIGTAFMPNMVTVYARSLAARRRVLRFCLAIGVAFTLPVWLIGGTQPGRALLELMYRMEPAMLDDVAAYLRMLCALAFLHVLHHYLNGSLILAGRTAFVSMIGITGVVISVSTAIWGFSHAWSPVLIFGGAEWLSGLFKLAAQLLAWRTVRAATRSVDTAPSAMDAAPVPSYRELAVFFWPVCISGMAFGLSRPLLFVFVSRVPAGVAIMAAMRVSMDFLMLFQAVVNQFRHFFAAFGLDDLAGKRRFMALVAGVLIGLMALVLILPPLSDAFFLVALGLQPDLYASARFMCVLLLVVPVILMVRNYYHGILIVRKRTAAMATGSLARVLAIAATGALLFGFDVLDDRTAVLGMIAGFSAEMLIARRSVKQLGPI